METFPIVGPLGEVYEVKRVRLVRDAQAAWCDECEEVLHSPYWGPSTSRWMHERGTGHRVVFLALA